MKKERVSSAQRGFKLLAEAGWKLKIISTYDLHKIALAINPELEHDGRLVIMQEICWLNGDLSPSLHTLSSGYCSESASLRTRLAFFREQTRAQAGTQMSHDVRLVYEFPRSAKDTRAMWLDCETGLPWQPRAVLSMRKLFDDAEREALDSFFAAAAHRARATIAKLNERTEWMHKEILWTEEREFEALEKQSRKDYWADWKTELVLATRYHPAGSAIYDKAERAEFLKNYLAKEAA